MPPQERLDPVPRTARALTDGDLDRILESVPCLAGRPRTVQRVSGGLTNVNVKVTFTDPPGRSVIARITTGDSALLGIDREAEHANSLAAARAGAAPPVTCRSAEAGVLVVEWVEGRTLTEADLRSDANLPRVAQACRRLHAGPPFVGDFDMFAVQRRYLGMVSQHGFRMPAGYLDWMASFGELQQALAVRPGRAVPCHNDLLAGNFIDDGARLWLIDFEYAGNNDPCFELGNIYSESELSTAQLTELVRLYEGGPDGGPANPQKVARARLFALVSQYGWALWAAIQAATSTIEFDFWSWGMDKYERAVAQFAGADFDRLMREVTAST